MSLFGVGFGSSTFEEFFQWIGVSQLENLALYHCDLVKTLFIPDRVITGLRCLKALRRLEVFYYKQHCGLVELLQDPTTAPALTTLLVHMSISSQQHDKTEQYVDDLTTLVGVRNLIQVTIKMQQSSAGALSAHELQNQAILQAADQLVSHFHVDSVVAPGCGGNTLYALPAYFWS